MSAFTRTSDVDRPTLLTIRSLQTQLDLMTHACTRSCAVECLAMLIAAFVILGVAVLLGSGLAVLHLQTERSTPPWSLAALHGLLAVGGLSCLALALRGPPRGLEYGVASFGIIAASLITLAALIGVALLATRIFKTRIAGIMIGIHATLAVGGFVILAAYVLLG